MDSVAERIIEELRKYPSLYKSSSGENRDKYLKIKSLNLISEGLNIPGNIILNIIFLN